MLSFPPVKCVRTCVCVYVC
uniref:Uncharacterized protein n=1 Tax=Anopheles dirus TaxID=7168 RepID=A0A182NWQ3_9DIPT